MSKLHQRIADKQREKRGFSVAPSTTRYIDGSVYFADQVFKDLMGEKTKALTSVVDAVEDMNAAAKTNELLTDFDRYELNSAMKLLVSDSTHFDAKMDDLLLRHDSAPIQMDKKEYDQAAMGKHLQFVLDIADEYTAMAQFFTNVIQRDIAAINTVVTRFEYRQDQVAKNIGVALPA